MEIWYSFAGDLWWAWPKVAQELPGMSAREIPPRCIKRIFKVVMGNVVADCLSIESGFFEVISDSVWSE